MNAKVKVLRNVLQSVIDDIDDGKYDRTDAEIDAAIEVISLLNVGIKRYSKRYLCDNILHCSESCFNNYLTLGIISAGENIVDENGKIDIVAIGNEMINNLITAKSRKYNDIIDGLVIGDGKIYIPINFINKKIIFTHEDIKNMITFINSNYCHR